MPRASLAEESPLNFERVPEVSDIRHQQILPAIPGHCFYDVQRLLVFSPHRYITFVGYLSVPRRLPSRVLFGHSSKRQAAIFPRSLYVSPRRNLMGTDRLAREDMYLCEQICA
jgi:hypothetical protein